MFRQFCICLWLAVSSRVLAGPIAVTLAGNFGTPVGSPTVFDQQNYQVTFVIADPHSPATFVDVPGPLGQVSVTYHVPARLSVPGIGLTADSNIDVNYNDQAPLGVWLNIAVFRGLPVGDFLILTPLQTISGAPLWNGLAGSLGTPEIGLLNSEPSSARWFLEQNTPDMGPIPIAFYETGTAAITQAAVPEPSTMALAAAAMLFLAWRMRN